MNKAIGILRAMILSALCVPIVVSCSNYLDFQEEIGNLKKAGEKTYEITIHAEQAVEGESILSDANIAVEGTTVTLTATLGAGRRVALSADGVTITPSTISTNNGTATFTMPANAVAVSATFSDIPPTLYGITVNQTGATGSDNITANVTEAAQGTTVTLTATLGAGRRVSLSADGVVITPSTISTNNGTATFTMPANAVVVSATFYSVFSITLNPIGATGSEGIFVNVSEAAQGTTITLTASLGAGRRVALSAAGVTITPATISASGDTATFTMPGNPVALTATFSDIPPTVYPITTTPSGATGSEKVVANVATAPQGTTVTLTATLGASRCVALSADGVVITPSTISTNNGTATFTMPANAVAITATFSDILYPITITPSGATGSEKVVSSVTTAPQGTTITLTATLAAGRRVVLSAGGVTITP